MEQNLFTNINGALSRTDATILKSSDESLRARYGVYETILLREGQLELKELHWQRLWQGMDILGFERPVHWDAAFFEEQIEALAAINGLVHLARIRLQIFAAKDKAPFEPQYWIESIGIPLSMTLWQDKGLHLGFLDGYYKPMIAESNCKISHSPHIPLAKQAMLAHAWDDVLLLNTLGNVIESAIANLFWIKDGMLYTPPLSEACLAGTMRAYLLQQFSKLRIPCAEQALNEASLLAADEVFLCNGIRFMRWVAQIGSVQYGNALTRQYYDALKKM